MRTREMRTSDKLYPRFHWGSTLDWHDGEQKVKEGQARQAKNGSSITQLAQIDVSGPTHHRSHATSEDVSKKG